MTASPGQPPRIVSHCALATGSFSWIASDGGGALTVVCKATYELRPERSPLAEVQDAIHEADVHWDGDPQRSLRAASDLVPYKPRVDIVVTGHAYAPSGEPFRSLFARLVVGSFSKTIAVFGDRTILPGGTLSDPIEMDGIPLCWERSAGGPDTMNPVGVRHDPADQGRARRGSDPEPAGVPNFQPADFFGSSVLDPIPPTGLGPLAPDWPDRARRLGRHAGSFDPTHWPARPLPQGFDARFFNSAPPDQQVDHVEPDPRLLLENLHSEHARLTTRLDGVVPHVMLRRRGGPDHRLDLRCDTIWIDTDRGVCCVTFRGTVAEEAAAGAELHIQIEPVRPAEETAAQPVAPKQHAPSPAASATDSVVWVDERSLPNHPRRAFDREPVEIPDPERTLTLPLVHVTSTVSLPDFTFAFESVVPHLASAPVRVLSFSGRESISSLYRYTLLLLATDEARPLDLEGVIGNRATLRIRTHSQPSTRHVHGIITEAEELGSTSKGLLYQLTLEPPLVRLAHRPRSRIFLEKPLRRILETVLLVDPLLENGEPARDEAASEPTVLLGAPFSPAAERFAFRITDARRLTDPSARPYCVQYEETDLAFFLRLLEEEGIRYHFESTATTCLLVLSDRDAGAHRPTPPLPVGPAIQARAVSSFRLVGRLRTRQATSDTTPRITTSAPAALARPRGERPHALMTSTCRTLSAGSLLRVEGSAARHDGEHLIIALESRGESVRDWPLDSPVAPTGVAYTAHVECAPRGEPGAVADSGFKPPHVTPGPRVLGPQTAIVTDCPAGRVDPDTALRSDAPGGQVRVRFPWDQETDRHAREPTSCWIRVSRPTSAGEQAPSRLRSGAEVVVEMLDGDPERPLVTGILEPGDPADAAAPRGREGDPRP